MAWADHGGGSASAADSGDTSSRSHAGVLDEPDGRCELTLLDDRTVTNPIAGTGPHDAPCADSTAAMVPRLRAAAAAHMAELAAAWPPQSKLAPTSIAFRDVSDCSVYTGAGGNLMLYVRTAERAARKEGKDSDTAKRHGDTLGTLWQLPGQPQSQAASVKLRS